MMHENLLQYFSKFIQLTQLDKEAIEQNFKPIKLKRKDFLLKEGMVCDFIAFLNSGVIRHYHKRWKWNHVWYYFAQQFYNRL